MTKIFVDSNFLIALNNPSDSLYERSLFKSREIEKEQITVVISNFIVIETVTVLSQRAGRKIAIEAGKRLIESGDYEIIEIAETRFQQSWSIFQDIAKKNMSFVDCSSIAVMQAEGINKFLTFNTEDFASLRKKYSFSFY